MAHYPIFLDLAGADILVVGAGVVGRRKVSALLRALPRSILVLDPLMDADTAHELEVSGPVVCRKRKFSPADLPGKTMVFAATSDAGLNSHIAGLCRDSGILCNCVTCPDAGTFIVPAHFTSADMIVAIGTGGQSPALAKKLREDLEAWVGKRYTPLLAVLGRLRPLVLELGLPSDENGVIFRSLTHSTLADLLEQGKHAEAEALLLRLLPNALHVRVGELLHEPGHRA